MLFRQKNRRVSVRVLVTLLHRLVQPPAVGFLHQRCAHALISHLSDNNKSQEKKILENKRLTVEFEQAYKAGWGVWGISASLYRVRIFWDLGRRIILDETRWKSREFLPPLSRDMGHAQQMTNGSFGMITFTTSTST